MLQIDFIHRKCNYVISFPGVNALCVLLRRLAYPNRLVDLEPIFGLCSTIISNIFNLTASIIYNNKGHLLENLRNVQYLNLQKFNEYSQVRQFF